MAERRMFAKTIIDSDSFLEMPATSQLLYFHLAMRADDEGFINKPRSVMKMVGAKDDDMNILIARKFVIPFESGIVVIKHWKIHNYIRGDRLVETKYHDEKSRLELDENNSYRLTDRCQADVRQMTGNCPDEDRLEIELGKDKNNNTKHKYGVYRHVLLTDEELAKLMNRFADWNERIAKLDEGIELKGYKYKNHYLAILKWAEKDAKNKKPEFTAEEMEVADVDIESVRKKMFG